MPNAIKYEAAWVDRSTVLGTELDGLANDARSAAGTEYSNQTNLDQYGEFELTVDFVSAPSAGAYVDIYMITAPGGTNYADGSATVDPGANHVVMTIPVRADTAAQRLTSNMFRLEPGKTKFLLLNKTGQAFPATGSILKLYVTNDEIQS